MTSSRASRLPRRRSLLLLALVLAALASGLLPRVLIGTGVRRAAAARGLDVAWTALDARWPLGARFRGLLLTRGAGADTLVRAESLAVDLVPWSLLALRPRIASLELAHAAIRLPAGRSADPDTLAPEDPQLARDRGATTARAERLRSAARSLARLLTAEARDLPRLSLRDVSLVTGLGGGDGGRGEGPAPGGIRLTWLELTRRRGAMRLSVAGGLAGERPVPFTGTLDYRDDDRISGGARFDIPGADRRRPEPLRITVDGALRQDRRAGRAALAESSHVTVGVLRFRLGGEVARQGPRFRLALAADSLTAAQWKRSLPRAVLGPLLDLSIRGWYAYRVGLDLDLSRPDSVGFTADVIPHGLELDPAGAGLGLLSLGEPFVARIHLPRNRVVERDLSPANPHFRPLGALDTLLVRAVVTNEDGGFFRHGGFNTEAVRSAIADNVKAGAFRRGAGTITMQLVRNLYLGHARTLSRKGQEVVLAWVLEHLTPLAKERMLEIYLNIIEWGPGIHGAEEAGQYYFGHDAGRVTVDEALFLATVVPSPVKWRYRLDGTGALRPFERAQMHFIGRAMVRKGWLSPDLLPAAESLRVELRGPARELLLPPAEIHADTTTI